MTPLEEVHRLFASAKSSTQLRTVISRAYYACFRRLAQLGERFGFSQHAVEMPGSSNYRSVHRRLFDFLRSSEIPVFRKIGRDLIHSLWRMRIKADYRFETPVTRPEAEMAVLMVQDVEDWITDAELI